MPNPDNSGEEDQQNAAKIIRDSGPFLSAGLQLAVSVILMSLLGWWLDDKWKTTPWLTLVGVLFGAGAGMYQFIKSVNELSRKEEKEKKEQSRH